MAAGRVDVLRRSDFYGHPKKEYNHLTNGARGLKSSRGQSNGRKHVFNTSPPEHNLGVKERDGYRVSPNELNISYQRGETQTEREVQLPPQKKRKFSPIIWDLEDKGVRISSRNMLVSSSATLSPPRPDGGMVDIVSDEGRLECPVLENQVLQSVKPHDPESLALVLSPLHQEQNAVDKFEDQMEEEELVQVPNIVTSRWASEIDSPKEISSSDSKQGRGSSTPESGEFLREDSEGHRARSSGSYQRDSSAGDEYSEFESGNLIDTDDKQGESTYVDESDSNTEEATALSQGDRNLWHGSRSVFEYEKLNKINEGTYGIVYRARDKKTGEIVALKKVKMNIGKEMEYEFPLTSLREINILMSFNHPVVVNVKEVVVDDSDIVFMVMEHVEHDIKGIMETMKQPFSTSEVKCLMLQLLEGVKYLHDNWIIHRDLKPSNLLFNNKGELKICDFGMSRQYGSPLKPYTQLVVTQWYRAPELLLGAKQYSTAIDMWSVGCIMAELLFKQPLFQGKGGSEIDQLHKVFAILGTPNEMIWPGLSRLPGIKANFVKQPYNMLRKKFPLTSFTGSPVLSDLGLDLLNKLLTYDPEKRITADAALDHDWFREVPLPKAKEFMPTFPPRHAGKR